MNTSRPILKNHKVYGGITSFAELMPILYRRKSIYFAPAGRVLPTKFFMGWSWMSGAVKKHLEDGSFWEVESYDSITRSRIRKAMQDCDHVPVIMFANGSKIIGMQSKGRKIRGGKPTLVIYNKGL